MRIVPWLWSCALGVLMLGGALGPGYVLTYDMVWVPDLALRSDFLGLGSSLPRAVPSDLVVALLDDVVPGMLLQKAMLLGTLMVAGAGAWRLLPNETWIARGGATTFYVWSPFVAERLGIGHWPLLMTYAALPWIYDAARRWADGERTLPGLVLWTAFASLSPAGAVIAAVMALITVMGRRAGALRRLVLTLAIVGALNAPWLVAGLLHQSSALSDPAGVDAFAAKGAGLLPVAATLVGLGGIWNGEVVPPSRTSWAAVASLLLLVAVCAVGATQWRRRAHHGRWALVVVGLLGLGTALVGALLPDAMGWLVAHVPGAGLLRDGSRAVALLAPLEAVLVGLGVGRIATALRPSSIALVAATGLALAPVALMPDAALGLSGQLRPVAFPQEFAAADAVLRESKERGVDGDLLALPFTSYRLPDWNHDRRTLDPIGRYLPANYLANDTLVVSGRPIRGEDPRAARVAVMLNESSGTDLVNGLREEGIRWVVLDREAQGDLQGVDAASPTPEVTGAAEIHSGERLVVWELPGENLQPARDGGLALDLLLLVSAWFAAALVVTAAAIGAQMQRRR